MVKPKFVVRLSRSSVFQRTLAAHQRNPPIHTGWLIDLSFISDLVLNFFFAFYDPRGIVVDNPKRITIAYLKGWFLLWSCNLTLQMGPDVGLWSLSGKADAVGARTYDPHLTAPGRSAGDNPLGSRTNKLALRHWLLFWR